MKATSLFHKKNSFDIDEELLQRPLLSNNENKYSKSPFSLYVENENDIFGFITYCIYKIRKEGLKKDTTDNNEALKLSEELDYYREQAKTDLTYGQIKSHAVNLHRRYVEQYRIKELNKIGDFINRKFGAGKTFISNLVISLIIVFLSILVNSASGGLFVNKISRLFMDNELIELREQNIINIQKILKLEKENSDFKLSDKTKDEKIALDDTIIKN